METAMETAMLRPPGMRLAKRPATVRLPVAAAGWERPSARRSGWARRPAPRCRRSGAQRRSQRREVVGTGDVRVTSSSPFSMNRVCRARQAGRPCEARPSSRVWLRWPCRADAVSLLGRCLVRRMSPRGCRWRSKLPRYTDASVIPSRRRRSCHDAGRRLLSESRVSPTISEAGTKAPPAAFPTDRAAR